MAVPISLTARIAGQGQWVGGQVVGLLLVRLGKIGWDGGMEGREMMMLLGWRRGWRGVDRGL